MYPDAQVQGLYLSGFSSQVTGAEGDLRRRLDKPKTLGVQGNVFVGEDSQLSAAHPMYERPIVAEGP